MARNYAIQCLAGRLFLAWWLRHKTFLSRQNYINLPFLAFAAIYSRCCRSFAHPWIFWQAMISCRIEINYYILLYHVDTCRLFVIFTCPFEDIWPQTIHVIDRPTKDTKSFWMLPISLPRRSSSLTHGLKRSPQNWHGLGEPKWMCSLPFTMVNLQPHNIASGVDNWCSNIPKITGAGPRAEHVSTNGSLLKPSWLLHALYVSHFCGHLKDTTTKNVRHLGMPGMIVCSTKTKIYLGHPASTLQPGNARWGNLPLNSAVQQTTCEANPNFNPQKNRNWCVVLRFYPFGGHS